MMRMNWRGSAWNAYLAAARPFVRMGITKIPVGEKRLGKRVDDCLRRLFCAGMAGPQTVHNCRFYHQLSNGERHVEYIVQDYERETRVLFEQSIQPGMTVVDAGAHIGYFTLLAARLTGSNGQVYAFEPDPLNYELLTRNVEENNFQGRVMTVRSAVTRAPGTVRIFRPRTNTSFNSIFRMPGAQGNFIEVEAISLDDFFAARNWPVVHVLKMDIEGAEQEALHGAAQLFSKNPHLKLFVEFNPVRQRLAGVTAPDFLRLLHELGFASVRAIGGPKALRATEREVLRSLDTWLGEAVNLFCQRQSMVATIAPRG